MTMRPDNLLARRRFLAFSAATAGGTTTPVFDTPGFTVAITGPWKEGLL